MSAPQSQPYRERLRVPMSWWALGVGASLTVWWVFAVALPALIAVAAGFVALVLIVGGLWSYGAVELGVGSEGLRAGRAVVPLSQVAAVTALDADETRRALGTEADARAYLVVRSYCPRAVKVQLDDPLDPTPYWLVSTRRPVEMATRFAAWSMQD